ncbi:hypothetical protein SDC9_212907 [bioreactor metagenome]|uniref:Uncharacterized protein n=1 Tax=bioreactor metagenome TaxID=1076179 RepID=A0A645JN88_9ZZZZ
MGVRTPERLHPPVQVKGHSALFAGGLGVKINQNHVRLGLIQDFIRHGKGRVQIIINFKPAQQI